jgi:hypothetical protein
VARIIGKTEVNCRQIFARARQRIAAGHAHATPRPGAAGGRRETGPQVLRGRVIFDKASNSRYSDRPHSIKHGT